MELGNGHGPEEKDTFADVAAELQSFVEHQAEKEADLRRELIKVQAEKRKAQRAIEVLTDRKVNQESKPKKLSGRHSDQWQISQVKLDAVASVMTMEPQTTTQIADRAGIAAETARKALKRLRVEDRVRMAGYVRAGKSNQKTKTFALMPDNEES